MEDALNGSHGLVQDVATFGDAVNTVSEFTGFSNESVIRALEELGRCMTELCTAGQLANRAFLEMNPLLLKISIDPDFAPRKLKKAYWKLFENRRVTWRERRKLEIWCRRGNLTLDKLSGKQVDAKTPD